MRLEDYLLILLLALSIIWKFLTKFISKVASKLSAIPTYLQRAHDRNITIFAKGVVRKNLGIHKTPTVTFGFTFG